MSAAGPGPGPGPGAGPGSGPGPARLRPRDVAWPLLSLLALVADTATDIILVVEYWRKDHMYWSLGTFLLIIVPAILIQLFSMRWHLMDEAVSVWHWVSHLCLLGVLHRYTMVIKTGFEVMESKSQHDLQRMYLQQSDICMLHLFESFLEAAPQLILQLYIMIMLRDWQVFAGISAVASLCSLSWAVVSYLRALRRARPDKVCARSPALILQVIWRAALLMARISALLLFAIGFHHWIFVLLGIHWFVMTIWVIQQKTDFCPSRPEEVFYNCIVGVIYCFCFFNLKEGQARYRMFAFYVIMIAQNITCLLLFLFMSEPDAIKKEITIIASGLIVGGTVIGLSSMLVFYRWFHPAGPIKLWNSEKQANDHEHHVESHQNNPVRKGGEAASACANYTLRSLKKPWLDTSDNAIKDEGVSLENSPQSEAECTDKKLLLDHWIARAGSPTFASAPIDKTTEPIDTTGVEFYSVVNTPEKYSRSLAEAGGIANTSFQIENEPIERMKAENLSDDATKAIKNKRRGICSPLELSLKFSSLERNDMHLKDLSDVPDLTSQKRRGICSSGQLEDEMNQVNVKDHMLDDMVDNLKSVSEISSKDSHERHSSSNEKTSSDSINLDMDLSFSDINSSDINEFNENIVQKLCLSTLKNIKNVHQDADIQNIQRIALEILKDLYSKGGAKDDQDLESELSSSVGRDLDTPSEVLSTHDYENICAVNIAREAWGLRSWRACADMGASPPPPPLPARRHPPVPISINRDQYINTVAYELSRCEDNDCQLRQSPEYMKEADSTVFIAKPYVVDQNGGMFPLATPLEPILEEIDEIIDSNNTMRKRQRRSSESALVATIDEIRHDTSTNSPRNVYHRADWDSPIPSKIKNEPYREEQLQMMHSTLRKSLWKSPPIQEENVSHNNLKDKIKQHTSSSNLITQPMSYKYAKPAVSLVNSTSIDKSNNIVNKYANNELKNNNIISTNYRQFKKSDAKEVVKSEKNNIRRTIQPTKIQQPKKDALKHSPKIKTVEKITHPPQPQEHNLSYEEVVFLSQLVSDSDSFLFKKNCNLSSTDDIPNLGISSSLQSLIDKDTHGSVPPPKTFDCRPSSKRSGNRPRRKFSLLREKFELKSKHSDEEMLFQSLESVRSVSHNNLDIASSRNSLNANPSLVVVNQELKIKCDKENLTPPVKVDANVSPIPVTGEAVVLSLTPCDVPQPNSSITNLKEKRSIFLKQVLSPPKINSWNKKL